MWCDVIGHTRRDCTDFTKALRSNVVYLWNGQVLVISDDQPDKRGSGAKRTSQVGKGGRKHGTGVHNGRKGVGTKGRRYATLIMRESEGEEAVHA